MVGSIGICGRSLCCNAHLSEFHPVSIKMAKEQNLSLNPTKISGVCGRLMCCLKYEEATYEMLNEKLPNVGDLVVLNDQREGEVLSVNVLRQLVKVVIRKKDGDTDLAEVHVDELTIKKSARRNNQDQLSKEELEELKKLEKMEQKEVEMKRD
jgi:cell fate regulator YaaT (PSP1 superfamily)